MKKLSISAFLILSIFGCNTSTNSNPSGAPSSSASSSVQPSASSSPQLPAFKFDPKKEYNVNIETNLGTMKLKLFTDKAPKTVENFTTHAFNKYYDNLTFHRIISGFMIQGGDPLGNGTGGKSIFGKQFEDEFSPELTFNRKGLIAMANSGPNTNGSQFFITLLPTPYLNNKHTIFGEIIEGMNVLDSIGRTPTGANDKPLESVVMKKVSIAD